MFKRLLYVALASCLLTACAKKSAEDQRIDALLSQMTLEEKVGQMNQIDGRWMTDDLEGDIRAGKIGSVLNHVDPEEVRELQRIAVEESRLGIPLLFARDIIHGFKTVFPIPLGQSTTWNPALAEAAARQTALEATQTGVRWTFSPMVDIARDPRWGRIAEGYGEDTYLSGVFGAATVRGYQGDDLSDPTSLAACVKHFAGYSASEGGRDYNTTWIPEIQLRDQYLPPFQACLDAGCASIMCSFNNLNGLPPSANRHLCEDILRGEWGYDGLMVSDWGSIHDLIAHGVAADNDEATVLGMNSHITMDMAGYNYQKNLADLVRAGRVSEKLVDEYVREILRMKIRMGLFENPYSDRTPSARAAASPQGGTEGGFFTEEALAVAQQCCEESAVLLKNNGVLPLNCSSPERPLNSKLYICGPLANNQHDQNGTWCFDGVDSVVITPMMAFKDAAHQSGFHWSREVLGPQAIQKMVAEARQADVILYFAGEEAMISGEAKTRAHLDLPGDQTAQLEALRKMIDEKNARAAASPQGGIRGGLVLVVMAGRPLCLDKEIELADAVIYAYHGGTMQGPALYNVLTGAVNPSGRLTTTFPHAVGQIPFYYNRANTGRPTWGKKEHNFWTIPVNAGQFSIGSSTYWLEYGLESAFPFGYGLSYTTFEYSPVSLSDTIAHLQKSRNKDKFTNSLILEKKENIANSNIRDQKELLTASVTVTNTGSVAGQEVVQLYIRDLVGSVSRPIRELKGFEKIMLQPGESREVTFTITPDMLAYWHPASKGLEFSSEPGAFEVFIAPNADAGMPARFELK